LTKRGKLTSILADAIKNVTNTIPEISTTGGTSDGRFISKICSQVVEFGPINASIHKINEHINITDIEKLKNIYKLTLVKILEN
jgi:succinyl-diaminopimelate desuccinylase